MNFPLLYDTLIHNVFSGIALVISLLSAFYSYRNGNIAKEALTISKNTFENKQSNFSLYLIDCFRLIRNDEQQLRKLLLFHLTINNLSENKNSFKATLEIEYIRDDDSVIKILLPHTLNLKEVAHKKKLTFFETEIRLEDKNSQSKWLIFEQPTSIVEQYRIGKYTIKIIDVNDIEKELEVVLLKDLNYAD